MRWEYKVTRLTNKTDNLKDLLNELGEEGWELIQCDLKENLFIFKRLFVSVHFKPFSIYDDKVLND